MISKDDFKTLEKYENDFRNAVNGYIRGIYQSDVLLLMPIYKKMGYDLSNPNCSDCVLGMFKRLANEYYKIKEGKDGRKKGRKTQEGQ